MSYGSAFGKQERESIAGISLDTSLPELSRTVNLTGTPDPASINAVHVNINQVADNFMESALTANTDGTITVNRDVLGFKITCMGVCRYASTDNVVLGIGIGDPSILPTAPGTSTGTLPDGTYISRFRDASRGEGTTRSVTLKTPYFPVGKTRTLGAKAGDKLFVVMWTEETDNASVIFDDLIMAVEAIEI